MTDQLRTWGPRPQHSGKFAAFPLGCFTLHIPGLELTRMTVQTCQQRQKHPNKSQLSPAQGAGQDRLWDSRSVHEPNITKKTAALYLPCQPSSTPSLPPFSVSQGEPEHYSDYPGKGEQVRMPPHIHVHTESVEIRGTHTHLFWYFRYPCLCSDTGGLVQHQDFEWYPLTRPPLLLLFLDPECQWKPKIKQC